MIIKGRRGRERYSDGGRREKEGGRKRERNWTGRKKCRS